MGDLSFPLLRLPLMWTILLFARLCRKTTQCAARARGCLVPPGPPGLPLIGNLLDLPKTSPWLGYRSLTITYENLVYMEAIRKSILMVDDTDVAIDLCEKRSSMYSSRPVSPMHKSTGWEWVIGFLPWRHLRRTLWQHFHPGVVHKYRAIQQDSARNLLSKLLQEPEKPAEHIRLSANCPEFTCCSPLKKGIYTPHSAPEFSKKACLVFMYHLAQLEGDIASDGEKIVRDVAGVIYAAGIDTLQVTLCAFFVAMTRFPEVQKKVQAELDTVVGRDRLPQPSDREHLPYVNAAIKEGLLRWHITTPFGLPHAASADDEYNGFFIPKDTMVMVNVVSLMNDPEVYPEPERFMPERFLKDG